MIISCLKERRNGSKEMRRKKIIIKVNEKTRIRVRKVREGEQSEKKIKIM